MSTKGKNQITTNEFLEFLTTSCFVNGSIVSDGVGDFAKEIDYKILTMNEIVMSCQADFAASQNVTSVTDAKNINDKSNLENMSLCRKSTTQGNQQQHRKLNGRPVDEKLVGNVPTMLIEKLDEIIEQGILDSVLTFIRVPPSESQSPYAENCSGYSKQTKISYKHLEAGPSAAHTKTSNSLAQISSKDHVPTAKISDSILRFKDTRASRRKSSIGQLPSTSAFDENKIQNEVIIHVCDEIKNTSKDFSCPQNLLVSKMGYFADVTAGQKLEDMDISVHCDIQIFEWLMRWVKNEAMLPLDFPPQLDIANVVQILVSASFLQMEPLLLDCLSFCHSHLNEIVRASTNLSCLNDSIVTRLAAMFTNLELEMVKDKKDRITPRLWTKMIQSLCEPEPQALRGHYYTLAGVFRCNKCSKYLTQSTAAYVDCVSNMKLSRWGQILSQHVRDNSWQITSYVNSLFKEMKSWHKVYWKLWGVCHFLYCCICETHFPVCQMNCCQYHSEQPQFLGPVTEGRIAGPAGRYPCCGQQAFRFETLPGPNGCKFREHSSILLENDRDRAILTLAQIVSEGLYDPPPNKPKNQQNSEPRWAGMRLMPTPTPSSRPSLLPLICVDDLNIRAPWRFRKSTMFLDSSSETESSETTDRQLRKFSTSSDGCESEPTSSPKFYHRRRTPRRRMKPSVGTGRYWSGDVSARSNQDNQRDFEERIMKQVMNVVSKKTGVALAHHRNEIGGSYMKLEADWREQVKQRSLNKQKLK